jgi:hypothetical protein
VKVYQELVADYVGYHDLEAELLELRRKLEEIAKLRGVRGKANCQKESRAESLKYDVKSFFEQVSVSRFQVSSGAGGLV